MTYAITADPLSLLVIASGQVQSPVEQTGSSAGSSLDVPQRALKIGDPVPIVFCRRIGSTGGILVSPGATEARFENSLTNEVTASYHLIISEGQIDSIPVKDVFQRSCRVGTFSQTYNRRAGTWTPGNFIVQRVGYDLPVCPYYCGTVGLYPAMSTLSFVSGAIPDGFDYWNRQVHAFIRGGMWVDRLEDSVTGPSNSIADLVLWMMRSSARLPDDVIDLTAMTYADLFVRTQGFYCDCKIEDSRNLPDFLSDWCPYFLLASSDNGGKRGLRPVLPTTGGGIDTGAVSVAWAFGEATIIPGTVEIAYTSRSERLPFVAQMIWRQQLEDDYGIIRTTDISFTGTAESGPYESHDLSEFCTNEAHAAKVGAYLLAKRVYTTHAIRFAAKPGDHAAVVVPGSVIRVRLLREAEGQTIGVHDYLYQVERVQTTLAGDISYEATHFPIDSQGRSLVALAVDAAQGTGITMASNRTGVTCDVNSSADNTIPTETWTDVDFTTDDNPFGEPVIFDENYGLIDGLGGEFGSVGTGLSGSISSGGFGGSTGGTGTVSGVSGDSMPPMDFEDIGSVGGGLGGGGGPLKPGDSIPSATAPSDGCTYTYRSVRVCGGEPANPFETSVGGYNGYIATSADVGCRIEVYTTKQCPGEEPVTTVDVFPVVCTPGSSWGEDNPWSGVIDFGTTPGTISLDVYFTYENDIAFCSGGGQDTAFTIPRTYQYIVTGTAIEIAASAELECELSCTDPLKNRIFTEHVFRYKQTDGTWTGYQSAVPGYVVPPFTRRWGPKVAKSWVTRVAFNGVDYDPSDGC